MPSAARLLSVLLACALPASADPDPDAACREAEGRYVTFQDFQGLRTTDAKVVTRV